MGHVVNATLVDFTFLVHFLVTVLGWLDMGKQILASKKIQPRGHWDV